MPRNLLPAAGLVVAAFAANLFAIQQEYKSGVVWPEPPIVAPGANPGDPPADAIILFDGKDLSQWKNGDKWLVKDGYAVVQKSDILTKESFGDYQLHVEFATPEKVSGAARDAATAASSSPTATRSRCSIPTTTRPISTASAPVSTSSNRRW